MRKIDTIIIHCSASRAGVDLHAKDIDRMHREQNGWAGIGYHFVVCLDGSIESGRPVEKVGAHAKGYNGSSLGVCYVGGLDAAGRPADTRTLPQRTSLRRLVNELCRQYSIEKVIGHRDVSPDTNGNGKVDPWERIKECPCFDVISEYKCFLPEIVVRP